MAQKVGFFEVQHETDESLVVGEVYDAVFPNKVLQQVNQVGDCQLLRRLNPLCDPLCQPGQTCDHSGQCIPYPQLKSVGPVSIAGLKKAIELAPPGYFDTDPNMPHPLFAPNANVILTAAGGDYTAFTMYGRGFTPLQLAADTWVITEGQDLAISWTADDDEQVGIFLRLNIDQHGNTPVELHCEAGDTGSVTISSSLVDELRSYGISGFPHGNVYRRSVDSVSLAPGCVEFSVVSHVEASVQVSGHIPCSKPGDCPPPLSCDLPTNTCI